MEKNNNLILIITIGVIAFLFLRGRSASAQNTNQIAADDTNSANTNSNSGSSNNNTNSGSSNNNSNSGSSNNNTNSGSSNNNSNSGSSNATLTWQNKAEQTKEKQIQQATTQYPAVAEAMTNLAVQNTVASFLANGDYQLTVLPVHADQWSPIAGISSSDWAAAKQAFANHGKCYSDMYWKVRNVSNKVCKTGFFKKEFDGIRDALEQRANW